MKLYEGDFWADMRAPSIPMTSVVKTVLLVFAIGLFFGFVVGRDFILQRCAC